MHTSFGKPVKYVLWAASIVLLAVACNGSSGTKGNLRFKDQSGMASGSVIPIALDREVTYTIRQDKIGGSEVDVASATSSNEDILQVVNFSGHSITVKGVSLGEATLDVVADDKDTTRDHLPIKVKKIANIYYMIDDVAGDNSQPLGLLNASDSYNLASGDSLSFSTPMYVDEDGNRLSGEPGTGLSAASSSGDITADVNTSGADIRGGQDGDEVKIKNAFGGHIVIRDRDDYAPKTLTAIFYPFPKLLDVNRIQAGTSFDFTGPATGVLRIMPVDPDKYRYVGTTDTASHVTVSDADAFTMTAQTTGSGSYCTSDSSPCSEWQDLPVMNFLVVAKEKGPKTITVTVKTAEHTQQDFTFNRIPKKED